MNQPLKRVGVCGTRAVTEDGPSRFTVRCATCDAPKTTAKTMELAMDLAIKTSDRPCRVCGAS